MVPVASGLLMEGANLFKKKLTIQLISSKRMATDFAFDEEMEAEVNSSGSPLLKRQQTKNLHKLMSSLQNRFPLESTQRYMKEAFNIKEDMMEVGEKEDIMLYLMNRELMENYLMMKDNQVLSYLVVGDEEGTIHIYLLNIMCKYKRVEKGVRLREKESNSFRRQSLNVTNEVTSRVNSLNQFFPHTLEANNCLRIKAWPAHSAKILSIQKVSHLQ